MAKKVEVYSGDIYGSWKIIKELDKKWCKSRVFLCKCMECGKEYEKRLDDLRGGRTKMCKACNNKKTWTTHGLSNHKLYSVFKDMHSRCEYKKHHKYSNYGGRGIMVCKEWEDTDEGLINFYNWSIENGYEDGLQLDRYDNYKGYSPENCRWVTISMNNFNRRNIKGYRKVRDNLWEVNITKENKLYSKYAHSEEEAINIRKKLEMKYYGEYSQNYR